MTIRKCTWGCIALLGAYWLTSGVATAAVIWSEDFENTTPPGLLTTADTDFTTITGNSRAASGSNFGSPETNKYFYYSKGTSISTTNAIASFSDITNSPFHLSFQFYDVAGETGTITQLRVALADEGTGSANRTVEIGLGTQASGEYKMDAITSGGTLTFVTNYSLNTAYKVQIFGSLVDGDPLAYTGPDGNDYTVAYQHYDIWLGETRNSNFTFRNNLTSIDTLFFQTSSGANGNQQLMYFDNIVLRSDFSVVPEPSAILLAGIGIVGLGFVRLRRRK